VTINPPESRVSQVQVSAVSQVLQRCEACGKVETPLIEGRCPTCVGEGRHRPAAHPFDGQKSLDREVEKYVKPDKVLPSTFLWVGLMLESLGAVFWVLGEAAGRSRSTMIGLAFLLVAVVVIVFGSILVSVGTIRWAVWPLIEKAEVRD
jgi:hypothetical protein